MEKETKKAFKANLFFVFCFLVLTSIYFTGYINSKAHDFDLITGYMPSIDFLKVSLFKYHDPWPLWNPFSFSGNPGLVKPRLGLDNLLGILILLTPSTILALKLNFVIGFFLLGLFMYCFMLYLGVGRRAAFIAGLVYMLNGHTTKVISWDWLSTLMGMTMIPLIFLFAIKSLKEKQWLRSSIITGLLFAIQLRGGPAMKVGIWTWLFLGIYFVYTITNKRSFFGLIKIFIIFGVISLLFFGLSAYRLLPNKMILEKSSRSQTPWEQASYRQLQFDQMWNRLIEPVYEEMPQVRRAGKGDHIGIITFLLVLFAFLTRWRNKHVLFFFIVAILSVMLANNTLGIYFLLWKYVPFFGSARYLDRSLFMFVFACSVLAGFGVNEILKKIKRKEFSSIIFLCLCLLIFLNLFVFNYNPFSDKDNWYDVNKAIQQNYILQNLSSYPGKFRIHTLETSGIDWGTDFYNVPLELEHLLSYDTIWYPPYFNGYLGISLANPAKFWGILNVKYVTSQNLVDIPGLQFIQKFENCTVCYPHNPYFAKAWGPYLYENKEAIPRMSIIKNGILLLGERTKNEIVSKDESIIYSLMVNNKFDPKKQVLLFANQKDLRDISSEQLKQFKKVILTTPPTNQGDIQNLLDYATNYGVVIPDMFDQNIFTKQISDQEVWMSSVFENLENEEAIPIPDENYIRHNFDKIEIKLNKTRGWLLLSEKFAIEEGEGWLATAYSDNTKKSKKLWRADIMITAIWLDGDEEKIIFEYNPKSFIVGKRITFINLFIILVYFLVFGIRYLKNKGKKCYVA